VLGTAVLPAAAKISPAEAERLGGDELTPVGAERAGNADGTFRPGTAASADPSRGLFARRSPRRPLPDDEPLFTITAANVDEHADKLSPGQIAMFKRYPDTFRMRIFPTRRSARLPDGSTPGQGIGGHDRARGGGNGLLNFTAGTPFPIPSSGVEVIWNHITRYRNDPA
jgi:hypothetical protein